jgi:hypothetical protein
MMISLIPKWEIVSQFIHLIVFLFMCDLNSSFHLGYLFNYLDLNYFCNLDYFCVMLKH